MDLTLSVQFSKNLHDINPFSAIFIINWDINPFGTIFEKIGTLTLLALFLFILHKTDRTLPSLHMNISIKSCSINDNVACKLFAKHLSFK